MRRFAISVGRAKAAAVAALLAVTPVACSDVTDNLLEALDPDIINPDDIRNQEGAVALYNGALERFRGVTGSGVTTWLFGGLLADEWSTTSTFVQNDETDQRTIQLNNSVVTGQFRSLNRVRTSANQAIAALTQYRPNPQSAIAEMYFARGFAELQLAQDFCNGIPLSDGSGDVIVFDDPKPVTSIFQTAIASFDSAIARSGGTDAASVLVNRAARVGRARALLGTNQHAQAATTVSGIPTSFGYQHTFSLTTSDNIIWSQNPSNGRFGVADSLEGNGRDILVRNAIPFGSARDPRLPVVDTRRAGQDGQTFLRTTSLYDRLTPIDVVNGIDARLVEAEAALKAGDVATWLSILNGLRTGPNRVTQIGTVTLSATALPALTDPGTTEARVSLHFREKAFWTFSRGQRLGDLRRLVRQYGRAPNNVFPVGVHYKGGNYGNDVNLPVPADETNNPKFQACLDRNA
jgi:starch-binding outer membrane protein, SusD/RagB family